MPPPDILMTTDASTQGLGASFQGVSTGAPWSKKKQEDHVNVLESKAVKLGLLIFTKFKEVQKVHLQMDNQVALTYLLKMGAISQQENFRFG